MIITVFCNKCGAKNPDGSGFCSSCGSKLYSAEKVQSVPIAQIKSDPPVQEAKVSPKETPLVQKQNASPSAKMNSGPTAMYEMVGMRINFCFSIAVILLLVLFSFHFNKTVTGASGVIVSSFTEPILSYSTHYSLFFDYVILAVLLAFIAIIIPGSGIIGACFSFLSYWVATTYEIERIHEIVEGIEVSYEIFASSEVLFVLALTGVISLIGSTMFLLQFMDQRKKIGKGKGFFAILKACWNPYAPN